MILNNFEVCVQSSFNMGITIVLKNLSGNNGNISGRLLEQMNIFKNPESFSVSQDHGISIIMGSGETSPTKNDYCLDAQINNLTVVNGQVSLISNSFIISQVVKNETSDNITIKEIGTILGVSGGVWSNWGFALLTREVLETPIIIEPGQSYTLTATIDF